jgi:hypothetical protein
MLHRKMIIHLGCLLLAYSPTIYRDMSVIMSVGPSCKFLYQVNDSLSSSFPRYPTELPGGGSPPLSLIQSLRSKYLLDIYQYFGETWCLHL